jgi:hypothetical protein
MLDLSLGNWRIRYEKVWAVVYLVPSDTRVLEIYLSKNSKLPHDELLYDESLNSYHSHICMLVRIGKTSIFIHCLCALSLVQLCRPLGTFHVVKIKISHAHFAPLLLLPWKYALPYIHPSRSTQKCLAPTLGVNTKDICHRFSLSATHVPQSKCSMLLSFFLSKVPL